MTLIIKNKKIIFIFFILIFCSCRNYPVLSPVSFYLKPYGILESGNINRFGVSEEDPMKMSSIIYQNYGISFDSSRAIVVEAPIPHGLRTNYLDTSYFIEFLDDCIIIVNERKYIIPRTEIEEKKQWIVQKNKKVLNKDYPSPIYVIDSPIDIRTTGDKFMKVDIGRIKITDKYGNLIRKKNRLPPIIFRVAGRQERWNQFLNPNSDTIFYGWIQDYPDYLKKIKKSKEIEQLIKIEYSKYGNKNNLLVDASEYGKLDLVKKLLENGADINGVGNLREQTSLLSAASKGKIEVMEFLLEKGADINKTDVDGNTPLMIAVVYGEIKAINLLLANGADVTIKNKHGNTVYDVADMYMNSEIIELLKNKRRNIE